MRKRNIYLVTGLTREEEARCWAEAKAIAGNEEPWFRGIIKAGGHWRFLAATDSGKRVMVVCHPITVRSNTKAAREVMRVNLRRGWWSPAYCSCGGDLLKGEHLPGCIRIPQKKRMTITWHCAPFFAVEAHRLSLGTTTLERVRAERARMLAYWRSR